MFSLAQMMEMCTDIETDDKRRERSSPWPATMQQDIWRDRTLLRRRLKEEMATYRAFWLEQGPAFARWIAYEDAAELRKFLQFPMADMGEILREQYGLTGPFLVLACQALEQIKHFGATGYALDGVTPEERIFEEHLREADGLFTLAPEFLAEDEKTGLPNVVLMVRSLGGGKLLQKRASQLQNDGDDDRDAADGGATPSFRQDRRLLRRIMMQFFADNVAQKFKRSRRRPSAADIAEEPGGGGEKEDEKAMEGTATEPSAESVI
mmetsp:Transcript_13812/g.40954  ORF Transcript_13812/g.40954 Transcript_13812/m.40954 type:complete len:265 (-) Transcript_13812:1068-1862(-)